MAHNFNFDNETNESTLAATRDLQGQTLEALTRIQNQAAETQAVGSETLAQLHQQDQQIDNVQQGATNLKENLKKTDKLQNRFAFLSMNFGNKKTAKEHMKADKKTRQLLDQDKTSSSPSGAGAAAAAPAPTFKRRGPRPKKNKAAAGDGNNDNNTTQGTVVPSTPEEALRQSTKATEEMTVEVERNELFAGRRVSKHEKKSSKGSSKKNSSRNGGGPPPKEQQLTEDNQRELDAIKVDDAAIDAGLDILGNQVESLLQLSKQMGETTAAQNTKLDTLQADVGKANDKTHTVNQRAKLFMMNRRQKKKENEKNTLGGFSNPVTTAAITQSFK